MYEERGRQGQFEREFPTKSHRSLNDAGGGGGWGQLSAPGRAPESPASNQPPRISNGEGDWGVVATTAATGSAGWGEVPWFPSLLSTPLSPGVIL
jgi:hypothetical protein